MSSELGGYRAQAQLSSLGLLARERLRQLDDVRARLDMALAALDLLAGGHTLAPARCRQLGNKSCLLKLSDGAEDLTHEDRSRGVLDEVRGRRRRDEGDSLPEARPRYTARSPGRWDCSQPTSGPRSAARAMIRFVIAENSAIGLSAFAVSRATLFSAAASWRFRLSFFGLQGLDGFKDLQTHRTVDGRGAGQEYGHCHTHVGHQATVEPSFSMPSSTREPPPPRPLCKPLGLPAPLVAIPLEVVQGPTQLVVADPDLPKELLDV